jgi:hypothetical protein
MIGNVLKDETKVSADCGIEHELTAGALSEVRGSSRDR